MAAPMWSISVQNFVRGNDDSAASDISQLLLKNEAKLLEIVEGLGKYLTDPDTSVRCRGTRLLADILHHLTPDFLQDKEVELLAAYLCEKLTDHHSIQPCALNGLLALSKCSEPPDGVAEKICRQIFKEVQNQTLAQEDRRSLYILLSNMLYKKLPELQKMEGDFVCGYIQAMDAERDPRNLIIAFQLAQTVIRNFPLGVFVEEMFEVTSCYFPIDFNPSAKDPGGITRGDLISALRGCMTASPKFGQYCLPLLIEKISSDIQSAKIDSLETLAVCCDVYGTECVNEFTGTLLSCIKREVFSGDSEELIKAALSALTAIVKTLSLGVTERVSKTYMSEFLQEIFKECKRYLLEPDLRLISPTCKLLQSVAQASDPACWTVLTTVIPTLLEQYATHNQNNQRRVILDNLKGFLEASGSFTYTDEAPSPLMEFKAPVVEVLAAAVEDSSPSLRLSAVQMQRMLLSLTGVLSGDEVVQLGHQVVKHLLSDSDTSIRAECVSTLQTITCLNVEVMKNKMLPQIISHLQNEPMETNAPCTFVPTKEYLLTTLTSLATHISVVQVVAMEIMRFLTSPTDNLSLVSAKCLSALARDHRSHQEIVAYVYETVLKQVLLVLLQGADGQGADGQGADGRGADGSDGDCGGVSDEVVTELAKVFRYTVGSLDRRKAEELLQTVCELLVRGNMAVIPRADIKSDSFKPLQHTSPPGQTRLVAVLMAVLCSLPRETQIPEVMTLLQSLLQLCRESGHSFTQICTTKCCAGLVNKLPADDSLESFIKKTRDVLTCDLELSPPNPSREKALNIWVWLSKALVLRGHSEANIFIQKLISLLDDPDLGVSAANGFLTIVSDHDDVMTCEMSAIIQLFYRQKLFIQNIAVLTDKFRSVSKDAKSCYLMAISHLLRFLPKQVLLAEVKALMPIMMQSLSCAEPDLLTSTLTKVTELTSDAPEIITKYIDTLVPQLLKLTTNSASMRVRIAALQCLNCLTVLPSHVTLTLKSKVTKSLQSTLDDKKRLVRRQAVVTRGNWFLIGEPGK
ncbi:MMS19 nucleotide excision repair protein homolog [Haliotis rufescens]|uniref:MMS19 nucleotide excision repair protein homolog n=1 Tax=Haliotis rufescens TaxID=6454 RepID=UPI00201EEC40|nr:MMS19 nucleotide excision repair protein homolog [Haliotis rufescens]